MISIFTSNSNIMNTLKYTIGAILLLLFVSCKKEQEQPGAASLTLINAVVDQELLRTNFKGLEPIEYRTSQFVPYGFFIVSSNRYAVPAGACPLGLYTVKDTLPGDKPVYYFNLDLPAGSTHTLFLYGQYGAYGSLLVKDTLPHYPVKDSVAGFRFINLCLGSSSVSVNLRNATPGSEVENLPFKDITGFKKYSALKGVKDYVFEFRNTETGTLIASSTVRGIGNGGSPSPNTWLYRNFTFALMGVLGGTGAEAPKVVQISHSYR